MSNRVTIEPTEFVNVRSNSEKTYGIRVYDKYVQAYDNTWDKIPDDDMDVLKQALRSDNEEIKGMLDFIAEQNIGVQIGGKWYDWDEIEECFV